MSRPLVAVDAGDPHAVLRALRDALTGDGPAVLPRQAESSASRLPDTVPQNVALVVETSGSTGRPKRVALSADALLASAAASAGAIGGQRPGTTGWLLALPAHYIAGVNVLVRALAAGSEPHIVPPGHFDPRSFCEAAASIDSDLLFTSLVPVQLARLLDFAAADGLEKQRLGGQSAGGQSAADVLRRFDAVLIGGQALQPDLRSRAIEAGLRVVRTYGSSETGGGCVYDGIPIGPVRARAVDGRLELAGPVLAEGYLADDGTIDLERTDASFHTADGVRWYRTGDLGTVGGDGRVNVKGRADNVIISGGVKVSLDAVQAAVRTHRGFGEAVIVAAPSDEWGQVPVAILEGEPPMTLGALREAVQADLGHAAAPAGIVCVERMPLLASGKPDRVELARLAAHELGDAGAPSGGAHGNAPGKTPEGFHDDAT